MNNVVNIYVDKINNILKQAKQFAENNEWEELEEFADLRRDEFLLLCGRIIKSVLNSEDDKWESWATICGSHVFVRGILIISLQDGIKINEQETTIQREIYS